MGAHVLRVSLGDGEEVNARGPSRRKPKRLCQTAVASIRLSHSPFFVFLNYRSFSTTFSVVSLSLGNTPRVNVPANPPPSPPASVPSLNARSDVCFECRYALCLCERSPTPTPTPTSCSPSSSANWSGVRTPPESRLKVPHCAGAPGWARLSRAVTLG